MAEEYMQFVNRSEAPQNNQEVTTSYEWALTFSHKPNIVFMPQDKLHEIRLKSVGWDYNEQLSTVDVKVRGGFDLVQPGIITTNGTITLNYQDFEDQAIAAMIQDWSTKSNTRREHKSAHKRDLYADLIIYRLNSFRKPIYKIIAETCLPTTGNYGDQYNSDKSPMGNMSLMLKAEFMEKILLNLV